MDAENIIADLNRGEKIDWVDYDTWQRKTQYLLNEQEVLETLTNSMLQPDEPFEGNDGHSIISTWKSTTHGSKRTILCALPC